MTWQIGIGPAVMALLLQAGSQAAKAPRWWTSSDWWVAIGTITAVIIALFGETFWAWWRRPKLSLSIKLGRPDCMKTTLTDGTGKIVAETYWFRVLVNNSGKRRAEDVEVYAEKLERKDGQDFKAVDEFPPMDFKWSHVGRPLQSISPGLQKHCDLTFIPFPVGSGVAIEDEIGQMLSPISQLNFVLEVQANQGGWSIGAGTYRLHIALAAANASVQRRVLEIIFTGQWVHDEARMFGQEIDIHVVP